MYKLLITLLLVLFACTGLKETMHKENPDFISNAYHYKITSPLAHNNASFNKFIIEDPNTKNVYEIEPRFKDPVRKVSIIDEDDEVVITEEGISYNSDDKVIITKEVISYNFSLSNPLNNKNYEVSGTKSFIREKRENTEEIHSMDYEEFIITEGDTEVGRITIVKPNLTTIYKLAFSLELNCSFPDMSP